MTDTRATGARVSFDVATASFATDFLHEFWIDECRKSLKDLALKEIPLTIVLRDGVELKLTAGKMLKTVNSSREARGYHRENAVWALGLKRRYTTVGGAPATAIGSAPALLLRENNSLQVATSS
jgi:hypothetical protein